MAYTAIDDPAEYFNTIIYTGDDSQDVTGVGFPLDLVLVKARGNTYNHQVHDSVRGATAGMLSSNQNIAEDTNYQFDSFDSDGFTTDSSNVTGINGDTHTQVAWCWKAGTSVSGDTTGSGTAKTYTGSVNTTSGISIINFVGNGTGGHTIPHHLGVAPRMILVKNRANTTSWQTYHYGLDSGAGTNEIFLDLNNATNGSAGAWNNTVATSTVVTKGDGSYGNEDDSNHIMYSFADVQGYSKFGSYTGNGNADGTFVYTGFRPAFVLCKNIELAKSWFLLDTKRDPFNPVNNYLTPDRSNVEGVDDSTVANDFVSNGFKLRATNDGQNESGDKFIYMAFAEAPLVNSNGVPCNAR